MENIISGIIRIIAEYIGKEESEINAGDSFTDLGLDSLDVMELVMQMQEEFGCKIELTQGISTIEDLAKLIESLQ